MATLTNEELANIEQLAHEHNKKRLDRLKTLARAAEVGSYLAGQHDLAEAFGAGAEGAQGMGEGHGAGALRKAGSNIAGRQAGKYAGKKGVSGGKSAALGGAVSSALQGEGVSGIAKGAVSWYLLWIAFGALVTLAGSIPALIYLNFHFIMSKLGSKIFGEMSFLQKIGLAAADLIALVLLSFLVLVPIVVICLPQTVTGKIASEVIQLSGAIPRSVCDGINSVQ